MKSNICIVQRGGVGLDAVLMEVEKVTAYNGMQKKEALRLRLLAEELVGMLSELVKNFDGCVWLQNEGSQYELHAELSVESLSKEKKGALIAVSASKKNAAASSFMGKIRDVAENMLLFSEDPNACGGIDADCLRDYSAADIHYAYAWTLEHYVRQQKERLTATSEEWDQLEKSIVAKLADDVIVGVRGKKVEIMIKKQF